MLADRESGADYRERVAQRYPPTGVSVSSVMAKSKSKSAPKGIDDQIIGGIRQIMSPWLGTPPAQNNKVTQAQGLARTAAETLDQTFAGGMIGAGVKGNKALAQQAALNAAALATGYVAGKAIQTASGAVVESGVLARAKNAITRQTVILHGSPVRSLSEITPQIRKYPGQYPDITPKVFMANPRTENAISTALNYSERSGMNKQTGGIFGDPGSVYIGKVKTKNISSPQNLPRKIADVFSTEKPVKVLKEIPTPKAIPSNEGQYKSFLESVKIIEKSLKRVGAPKAKPYNWKY